MKKKCFLSVMLLLIFTVFISSETVIGQPAGSSLEEELRKLRDAGIPTTLKELAPPQIPDSENAALIYQKVFGLMEKNKEDIDILKSMFYKQYQEGGRSFSRYSAIPEWSKWSEEQKKNFPLLIEKNKEIFQFLEKAVTMPKCRFPIDYYLGPAMSCLHLSKLHNCAFLLAIKATIESEKENSEKALNTLIVGFGISRALSIEPLLNSQMVRISIDRTLIRKANTLLSNKTVSVDMYEKLTNTLKQERNATITSLGFHGIYPMIRWHFDYFKKYPEKEYQLMTGTEESAQEKEKQEKLLQVYLPVIEKDEIYAINEVLKLVNLTKKPYWEVKEELQKMEEARRKLKGEEHFISLLSFSGYGGTYVEETKLDALLGAAEIGLANRIYRKKHGEFVNSLKQLTPEILSILPLDPFTGKDYVYRKTDKGFIVYSVGEDLTDDGGVEEGITTKPDIVWEDRGLERLISGNSKEIADTEVSGRVVDEKGNPISGAQVYVFGPGQPPGKQAITNSDGTFHVYGLAEGNVIIDARLNVGPGYPRASLQNIQTGSKNVKIVLQLGKIRGIILDEQGNPVSNADLALIFDSGNFSRGPKTGNDGRFEIMTGKGGAKVPDGTVDTWRLFVREATTGKVAGVPLPLESDKTEMKIVLKKPCAIRGKVVDIKGKGIESALVHVSIRVGKVSYSPIVDRSVTHHNPETLDFEVDKGGNFLITGLPADNEYFVYVRASGYKAIEKKSIFLEAGLTSDLGIISLETANSSSADKIDYTNSSQAVSSGINREQIETNPQSATNSSEGEISFINSIIMDLAQKNNTIILKTKIASAGGKDNLSIEQIEVEGDAINLQDLNAFRKALETENELFLAIMENPKTEVIKSEKITSGSERQKFTLHILPTDTHVISETPLGKDLKLRVLILLENLKSDSTERVFSYLTPELRKRYSNSINTGEKRGQLEEAKILYTRINSYRDPSMQESTKGLVVLHYKLRDSLGEGGITISEWIKDELDGDWLCSDLGISDLISR
jgi:hypothetical protein